MVSTEKSLCLLKIKAAAFFTGSKHKTMLEARSGAGPIKAYPRPGAKLRNGSTATAKGSGLQNKTFHCQICDVHVNSEIQLKQVETPAATVLCCFLVNYEFNLNLYHFHSLSRVPESNLDRMSVCIQTP